MGKANNLVERVVANVASKALFAAILAESVAAAQLDSNVVCDGTRASLNLVSVTDLAKLSWYRISWGNLARAYLAQLQLEGGTESLHPVHMMVMAALTASESTYASLTGRFKLLHKVFLLSFESIAG